MGYLLPGAREMMSGHLLLHSLVWKWHTPLAFTAWWPYLVLLFSSMQETRSEEHMDIQGTMNVSQVISQQKKSGVKEKATVGHTPGELCDNKDKLKPAASKETSSLISALADQVFMLLWVALLILAKLILQAPRAVFEADSVVLRCRGNANVTMRTVKLLKNNKLLADLTNASDFHIEHASLRDNGVYKCTADKEANRLISSNDAIIQVQELFPPPVLRASSTSPTAGNPVTLTCSTRLAPQRFHVQLQFRLLSESLTPKTSWKSSPEIQVTFWKEDSGYYFCQARIATSHFLKESRKVYINVKVPVSPPVLTLSTPRVPVLEGDVVTLQCEAQSGSPPIQYQFFHEGVALRRSRIGSWGGEHLRLLLTAEHSGDYYCTASNGHGAQHSRPVSLSITVPVSPPVLTLSTPRVPVLEGDVVTLHCEAQSGSLPIFYQFYHENVILKSSSTSAPGRGVSFSFPLSIEHSGNYHCTGDNGFGHQHSEVVSLSISVPVSRPVLTIRTPSIHAAVGDVVELRCETQRGSPPILYEFYQEEKTLGNSSALDGGGVSFNLSLTEEHSGNYACVASNDQGAQHSEVVSLQVIVPVSQPVLTLRVPRTQAVVGDMVELHCDVQNGSPPILYWFYHGDIALGSIPAPSGGGTSFSFSLTAEHSGSYSCQASNGFRAQHSEAVTLKVAGLSPHGLHADRSGAAHRQPAAERSPSPPHITVDQHAIPVSRPVLTLTAPAQAAVGDVVELHCEAQRGSPPILYQFYHEDVTLGSSSAPSGGGASFNLSLTTEHSGNYSCEADNGLGAQLSEMVALSITGKFPRPISQHGQTNPPSKLIIFVWATALGAHQLMPLLLLPRSRVGAIATSVTGALLSIMGLAVAALLLHHWTLRNAGRRPVSDPARSASDSAPQEHTYYNVPGWLELQPVYSNVNPKREEVIYTEVQMKVENKPAVSMMDTCGPARVPDDKHLKYRVGMRRWVHLG
ncbi:Fc receptor-like protein 5 [Galemys pyrenaicus]|uniref:Fc receptor-like protein 5 n=1 Tax=Galemys pyrenaicus TaxID=202257 RepID=A0A8J6B5F9_GALPY|nr:Fc receptor-like protein 5 [Galemys pyrenaicus]